MDNAFPDIDQTPKRDPGYSDQPCKERRTMSYGEAGTSFAVFQAHDKTTRPD